MSGAPKNADLDSLFKAVGSAITTWSVVEIELYQIFTMSLSLIVNQGGGWSLNSAGPGAVLGAVEGFRVKLQMIDAALKAALADLEGGTEILADWAVASERAQSLHGCRSKLAHWKAARMLNSDGSTKKCKLQPPFWAGKEGTVWETDIKGFEDQFWHVKAQLSEITQRLSSHQGLQRKFVEQVASQIRLSPDPSLREYLEQQLSEPPQS